MANTILVNINRCTGCWSCSTACKMAFDLDADVYWEYIRTIGGGELDEPGGEWPNLYMKWMPVWKQSCVACNGDASTGKVAFCAFNCPTGALVFGDIDDESSDISKTLAELKSRQFRVYELPAWEDTREGIIYAEKGI